MKVIKPEVDLETWPQEHKCPHCTSIIAIENEDVFYEYHPTDGVYKVNCCLCHGTIRFKDGVLPKIVEASADKHRCIIHYSDD